MIASRKAAVNLRAPVSDLLHGGLALPRDALSFLFSINALIDAGEAGPGHAGDGSVRDYLKHSFIERPRPPVVARKPIGLRESVIDMGGAWLELDDSLIHVDRLISPLVRSLERVGAVEQRL